VAVYLDAWHKDLPEFLALRTNNGDDRMKAHDVFPAICYPDLFWKMAKEDLNATWYLLCPHEVYKVMGYHLEDYYGEEWEQRYLACIKEPALPKRAVVLKDLVRLILKSAVETGTPFTFNRDLVNRSNPNHHKGIIYCSNLCTEIAQNMSPIELYDDEIVEINGETIVVSKSKPQDFVVCNLASLSLGNLDVNDHEHLRTIIHHVIRALDNVIDLNYYPIPYAKITNQKYRAIGLGVSGYHHMLVKQGIRFESQEHLDFVDQLFEKINYYAIEASSALSKEKGCYSCFMGSDWQTGAYFEKRNYKNAAWQDLQSVVKAQGMRNGYLLAIAPTSSTSIISGTSAGVDPIMNKYFLEEKKGSMIARVAPDLNAKTFWLYKNAHLIDQEWIVKSAGIRARHIDQAQSVNLYITNEFTLRQVLMLFIHAWEYGVKTLYYVRSKSLEVEECESCSS
jgi:ribonucleoside-diphosphate reductase alpha chain